MLIFSKKQKIAHHRTGRRVPSVSFYLYLLRANRAPTRTKKCVFLFTGGCAANCAEFGCRRARLRWLRQISRPAGAPSLLAACKHWGGVQCKSSKCISFLIISRSVTSVFKLHFRQVFGNTNALPVNHACSNKIQKNCSRI